MGLPNNLGKLSNMITSTGSAVGIGTTSPNDLLEVRGGFIRLSATSGNGPQFNIYSNGQTSNHITLAQGFALATDNIGYLYNRANADFVFGTNNAERLRITSTGNVGINTSSPVSSTGSTRAIQIGGSTIMQSVVNNQSLYGDNAYYDGSGWKYAISNNAAAMRIGALAVGDFTFHSAAYATAGSSIPNWDSSDIKMTIKANGKVGIGTTNPDNSYQGLTIFGSDPSLRLKTNSTGGWTWTEYVNSSNVNNFSVGVNQAAPFFGIKAGAGMDNPNIVLTSAGNIGFGLTNPGRPIVAYYSVAGSVMEVWNYRNNGSGDFAFVTVLGSNDANTNNYHYIASTGGADRFYVYGNGNVVNTNGSYGTLSDSTLKENIVDATPKLDDLLQLKVRNFNLIDDENKTKQIGFIAQEFEEVFPAMIDNDGKTGMKTIKTSVLVPMLVKAIQELSAKVTALESKS